MQKELKEFQLNIGVAGAFPNWKRPSVLWLGLEPVEEFGSLSTKLDEALYKELGIRREKRELRAHITVARLRSRGPIKIERARKVLEDCASRFSSEGYVIPVDRFHLYHSTLTPEGPRYEKKATYELLKQ